MQQAAELNAVGAMVGAKLTPENTTLPDLRFASAFMLSYGGSPMGVLAYVDSRALRSCFVSSLMARLTNPSIGEARRLVARLVVAWRPSHLVIGHVPEERAIALAQMIKKQV